MLANPPFGVEWKQQQKDIDQEKDTLGFAGRFGTGTPRVNDGALLFLQHMIAKMRAPQDGGSRIAIVFNGSPLFTGDAGGGENEIRRWIIDNDWLEAIVALPEQLFYNTGISTCLWVLTNRKEMARKAKVQLIDPALSGCRWKKPGQQAPPHRCPQRQGERPRPHRRTHEDPRRFQRRPDAQLHRGRSAPTVRRRDARGSSVGSTAKGGPRAWDSTARRLRHTAQGWPEERGPTLGWSSPRSSTPTGLRRAVTMRQEVTQPRWGWGRLATVTQGSACRATLGCKTESPWDSPEGGQP